MRKVTKKKVADLERKIAELDSKGDVLVEKYQTLTKDANVLLVKYGGQMYKHINEEVEARMDDIEYRILKKLVDGKYFELKMREKNGHRKVKEND